MIWVNRLNLITLILTLSVPTLIFGMPFAEVQQNFKDKALPLVLSKREFASPHDVQIQILNAEQIANEARRAATCNIHIEPGADLIGKTVLFVDFYDENQVLIKKSKLWSQVSVYSNFLKTKHLIQKDQVITSKDVVVSYEDDYAKPIKAFHSLDEIGNKVTAATLGPNVYLATFMVKNPIIIHRGDTVDAILVGDHVEVKIRVIALEEGCVHEKIKLRRSLRDHKTLEGEIIDSQTVRIAAVY